MLERMVRFSRKILKGGHPVKIKYSEAEWDAQYNRGKWDFLLAGHPNIALVSNSVKSLIPQDGVFHVLDIGCGNGALARKLSDDRIDYTGTDISSVALAEAKKNLPQGNFFQSSMDEELPINKAFDVIIFCEVLIYGDYEQIIEMHKKHLKPGGYIVISLYDNWRTKIIWRKIKKKMSFASLVFVKDLKRNIGWTIGVCKF